MTQFAGKVAISSIFEGFVACLAAPPGAVGARRLSALWDPVPPLWRPVGNLRGGLEPLSKEGYPPCAPLVAPCGDPKKRAGAPTERIADIDAWRLEASMPGWPGWLAWLAGWLA